MWKKQTIEVFLEILFRALKIVWCYLVATWVMWLKVHVSFLRKTRRWIDSTFGAAEQNLIHSFDEMRLNWSLVGTENERDSFVTPPSSPVSDFQDAFDNPLISFCKCSSQVSEQSVEMSVFESLNNILVHHLYKNYASKSHVSTSCLWCVSSWSESFELLVRQAEYTTSGQGSFKERSPKGSRFSVLLLLDVPGTAAEQVRTCGFRTNSSSLDKATKMRDSVRLNSWEIFLVTLPSISSENWVMYSSVNPWLNVFCEWLFLVLSGVSLETADNFLLFLDVAIILKEKLRQLWKLNWYIFLLQIVDLLFYEGKVSNKCKQLTMESLITIPERLQFIYY